MSKPKKRSPRSPRPLFTWAEFEPGDRLVCETPDRLHGLSHKGGAWHHTPFLKEGRRWRAEATRPIDQEGALRMLSGRFGGGEPAPASATDRAPAKPAGVRHGFALCVPGTTKILSRHRKEDLARAAKQKAGEAAELWRTEKGRPIEKLA